MSTNAKEGGQSGTPEGGAPAPADPMTNLKGEFNRKIGNVESDLKKMNEQLAKLVSGLAPKPAPAPAQKEPDLESLWYDKPTEAAAIIAKQIKNEIRQEQQSQNRQTATIAQLVADFPELNNAEHDLTKAAVAKYQSMSDEERANPASYRAAVMEAALELDLKPKSKRKAAEDSEEGFALGSSGGGSGSSRRSRDQLDPGTLDFARIMGLNVDDPKVKERLKTHAKKTWSRYS